MVKDRIGKTYGKLTVVSFAGVIEVGKTKKKSATWNCQCSCGNPKTVVVRGNDLHTGNTQSCGCIATEYVRSPKTHGHCVGGKSKEFDMIIEAKKRATRLELPFDLTPDDIEIPERCPLIPSIAIDKSLDKRSDESPSLDRIIPEKGYVKGNVQVISDLANRMKNSASFEQWHEFCTNSIKFLDELHQDEHARDNGSRN